MHCHRASLVRVVFWAICAMIFVGLVEVIVMAAVVLLAIVGVCVVGHQVYRAIANRRHS